MTRRKDKYQRERYTKNEIDAFSLYCPDTDKCYLLFIEDVSSDGVLQANVNLRTHISPQNNQHKTRMAEDYIL